MAALASDWMTHFPLLKNDWRDLLQAYHKCSLWGPNQVLLLFKPIRNPIWPPWSLIGWHTFNFFSRMAAGIYSKLATNVLYEVPTKSCYFLSGSEIWHGHPSLWFADTFFWRMAAGIYSKLATNAPYDILTKCCYYLSGSKSSVAVLVSDWLTSKKLIISFYVPLWDLQFFNWNSGEWYRPFGLLVLNKASNYITLGLFILHVFYFIVERIEV